MATSFQQHHGAMLLKYAGISFISGAVNHGFFSGTRSIWTAGIGMVLFVLGAWLEHRLPDAKEAHPRPRLIQALVWGSMLSIGLGFFTGGLQHFPDSPARSAWVVPLGFAVSVLALALSTSQRWQRSATVYVLVLGSLVSVGSWSAYEWLLKHPEFAATGHSHSEEAPTSQDDGPMALVVSRSIDVRMDDQMRFTPAQIDVRAGETIRFVVHNAGQTTHEMVLGSDAAILAHAEAMQTAASHSANHPHDNGAAVTVAPGQKGELVVRFPDARQWQLACLIPGHYEAGMRGTVNVRAEAPSAPSSRPAPAPHDHSNHTH